MNVEIRIEHELHSQGVSECLLNALLLCSESLLKTHVFPNTLDLSVTISLGYLIL